MISTLPLPTVILKPDRAGLTPARSLFPSGFREDPALCPSYSKLCEFTAGICDLVPERVRQTSVQPRLGDVKFWEKETVAFTFMMTRDSCVRTVV